MNSADSDVVEVRFKNTRKEFFKNPFGLIIKHGDLIAVASCKWT